MVLTPENTVGAAQLHPASPGLEPRAVVGREVDEGAAGEALAVQGGYDAAYGFTGVAGLRSGSLARSEVMAQLLTRLSPAHHSSDPRPLHLTP